MSTPRAPLPNLGEKFWSSTLPDRIPYVQALHAAITSAAATSKQQAAAAEAAKEAEMQRAGEAAAAAKEATSPDAKAQLQRQHDMAMEAAGEFARAEAAAKTFSRVESRIDGEKGVLGLVKDMWGEPMDGAPPTRTSVGHQLLPSQTMQHVTWLGRLVLLLDAMSLGLGLGRWLPGYARLRNIPVVVGWDAGTPPYPTLGAVLRPPAASDTTYNSAEYNLAVLKKRLQMAMMFASLVNFLAWMSVLGYSFLPSPYDVHFAWLLRWALDSLILLLRAMTEQKPSFFGFAVVMFFVSLIAMVLFALRTLELAPITLPFSGTGEGDVAAVLPLVLDVQGQPFSMVSYAWLPEHQTHLPRALAAVMPNCWIDTQMLASGTSVPEATSAVARDVHCLVLVLTPEYLSSKNCTVELVSALLYRKRYHITYGFARGVPETVLDALRAMGVRVIKNEEQDMGAHGLPPKGLPALIKELSSNVYRCLADPKTPNSGPENVWRVLSWFARYSIARESVSRRFHLPPPDVQDKGGPFSFSGRILRPRRSLVVGPYFLSPDGLSEGLHWAVTAEQSLLLVVLLSTAATFGLFFGGWAQNVPVSGALPQDTWLLTWTPILILLYTVVWAIIIILVPFSTGLDIRLRHSSLLLPLCVAAYLSSKHVLKEKKDSAHKLPFLLRPIRAPSARLWAGAPSARVPPDPASSPQPGPEPPLNLRFSVLFAVSDATGHNTGLALKAPQPGAHAPQLYHSGHGLDDKLHERLLNTARFLHNMGITAKVQSYGAAEPFELPTTLCIVVFVLRSMEAAEYFLEHHAEGDTAVPRANTVLLVEGVVSAVAVQHPRAVAPALPYYFLETSEALKPKDEQACSAFCAARAAAAEGAEAARGGGGGGGAAAPAPRSGPAVRFLRDLVYLDLSLLLKATGSSSAYAGLTCALLDHIGAKIGACYQNSLRKSAAAYEKGGDVLA